MSLELMRKRMDAIGGPTNDGRINKGKLQSMLSAQKNSYQAECITFEDVCWRCLINPDKLTTDYDQKEISIEFESGMKPGKVFYWNRTDTHWMVINQRLTEEAYFRGQIRQCDYQIEGNWVWLRGPVETSLIWKQKHQIMFNDLNYSISFWVERNAETDAFFTRHQVLKFDGHNWRVAATDRYSQEGIIEVYLEEYFDNEMQDAQIIPEIEPVNKKKPYIDGPQIVKPFDTGIVYIVKKTDGGVWVAASKKVKIVESNETSCTIDVVTSRSGDFVLQYIVDDEVIVELPIIIESL